MTSWGDKQQKGLPPCHQDHRRRGTANTVSHDDLAIFED